MVYEDDGITMNIINYKGQSKSSRNGDINPLSAAI
jgi:hypothetical protein